MLHMLMRSVIHMAGRSTQLAIIVANFFLAQWDQYKHYPGGVLAHSTHLKGIGHYDREAGIETSRISVTLATGIPAERCQRINLGYLDPVKINQLDWEDRESEGILVVPKAGEILYRIKQN